jgi:heterodisulfide reductase subunit A2
LSKTREVLIIGGGISGMTVALELARLGIPSTLVEREARLGGLSASFCCKASESCNKCFACVVDKRASEIGRKAGVSVLTRTDVTDVQGVPGDYRVFLSCNDERLEMAPSAVVIAAGIDPYNASEKAEYGYGRYKNVITARDLDEMLRFQGRVARPSDGEIPRNVAFFQCVGSRDESIGHLYCSQVCCAYALRLIRAMRHQYSDVKATFLYMDIQPAGVSFQNLLTACRQDSGIRLVRSLPSKVYLSPASQSLRVRFTDTEKEDVVEESFELIVLSVGMVLHKNARGLVDLFGLQVTEDDFIAAPPPESGLFVAGACTGPKDIDRSIVQSKSTALRVHQYVKGGA